MIAEFQGAYRFLSNFFPSQEVPPTLEHRFQAEKTLDLAWINRILGATTPGAAKRLGRKAPLRKDWDQIKDQIMLDLVRKKFKQPDLRRLLLMTGTEELVEGNDWGDMYWGVVYSGTAGGRGHNKLGKILMQVRNEVRQSQ